MTDLSSGIEETKRASAAQLDDDPQETAEWLEALDAIVAHVGKDRAQFLLDRLTDHAYTKGLTRAPSRVTPYVNTIPVAEQPPYPGDLEIEARLAAARRREAGAMGSYRGAVGWTNETRNRCNADRSYLLFGH